MLVPAPFSKLTFPGSKELDTEHISQQTYFNSEPVWFLTYLIPNISDSEPI